MPTASAAALLVRGVQAVSRTLESAGDTAGIRWRNVRIRHPLAGPDTGAWRASWPTDSRMKGRTMSFTRPPSCEIETRVIPKARSTSSLWKVSSVSETATRAARPCRTPFGLAGPPVPTVRFPAPTPRPHRLRSKRHEARLQAMGTIARRQVPERLRPGNPGRAQSRCTTGRFVAGSSRRLEVPGEPRDSCCGGEQT